MISDITFSSGTTTLVLWLSAAGLTVLFAVASRGSFIARLLGSRTKTNWIETSGSITRTDIYVRKQPGRPGGRSKVDFVVRIEFDYQNSAQMPNTWTQHGIQEVSYKRLDLARQAAEQYAPGTKIQIHYNAEEPSQSRFSPQWKKRV